jgi:hypothetical protein
LSAFTDKRLVVELAIALSQFMQQALPHNTDANGFVSHSFHGPFDENCYILWELGAALAAPPSGERGLKREEWGAPFGVGPSAFKFFSPDETRAVLNEHTAFSPELVFRLICTYLNSMCDYGWQSSILNSGREPFLPAKIFQPQLEALIDCGYLTQVGGMVHWTNQIGKAMQATHYWDATFSVPSPPVINLSIEARAQVERMIRDDQRIAAISFVCEAAKVGISDAKAFVENLEKSMSAS